MKPIDMILYCPNCGMQHIDAPDSRTAGWDNPPHKSHLCHGCGCIWRPADVATNGVAELKTSGKDDTWLAVHNDEVRAMPANGVAPTALALPRRGLVVLKNVIQLLREEARFVDEEGDDTNALDELLEALCADGVKEVLAPEFKLVGNADFHMSAELDVCIGAELYIRTAGAKEVDRG